MLYDDDDALKKESVNTDVHTQICAQHNLSVTVLVGLLQQLRDSIIHVTHIISVYDTCTSTERGLTPTILAELSPQEGFP